MFQRKFHCLLLVLLTVLVTDEVQSIYTFKRAPNQFRKRVFQQPPIIFAWCDAVCDNAICRVVESSGKYDNVYSDCECGLDCYCLYSETRYNSYIYRCMPA
ncbi:hypothetical protein ACROYT_G002600 [Oculina patagonica]